MLVARRPLSNRILLLPNSKYFFNMKNGHDNLLALSEKFAVADVGSIYLTAGGMIGIEFSDTGQLRSIEVLETVGSGSVPEEVMKNQDNVISLQESRISFSNFISSAFFGKISANRNYSLDGARYANLEEVFSFGKHSDSLALVERIEDFHDLLATKIKIVQKGDFSSFNLSKNEIQLGVEFVIRLWTIRDSFIHADLKSCANMNYQAAILHRQQHSAASLALNFSVIESLVHETLIAYGIVSGFDKRPYASKPYKPTQISKNKFGDLSLSDRFKLLSDVGIVTRFTFDKFEEIRKIRNDLMHRGHEVNCRQSGISQVVVRDLWHSLIGEPFGLISGWSYRY